MFGISEKERKPIITFGHPTVEYLSHFPFESRLVSSITIEIPIEKTD